MLCVVYVIEIEIEIEIEGRYTIHSDLFDSKQKKRWILEIGANCYLSFFSFLKYGAVVFSPICLEQPSSLTHGHTQLNNEEKIPL